MVFSIWGSSIIDDPGMLELFYFMIGFYFILQKNILECVVRKVSSAKKGVKVLAILTADNNQSDQIGIQVGIYWNMHVGKMR
jgi:hypothetical protein